MAIICLEHAGRVSRPARPHRLGAAHGEFCWTRSESGLLRCCGIFPRRNRGKMPFPSSHVS